MTDMKAKKAGYYYGYQHGLAGNPHKPDPDLMASLSSDAYLESYLAAYDQGFSRAKSDRDLILRGKTQTKERNEAESRER